MKLCKDCKHFKPMVMGYHVPVLAHEQCRHPDVPIELVYGSRVMGPAALRASRYCGPEAAWFEAIPPEPPPSPVVRRPWWRIFG